jgi:hypothetical protein
MMSIYLPAILILATIIVDDPQDSCRAWRKAGAKHVISRRVAPKQSAQREALSLGVCASLRLASEFATSLRLV